MISYEPECQLLHSHAVGGMETSASGPTDEGSEYGSDFATDEEEILNGLLQVRSVFEAGDNPIINPELQLQDAKESGEGPQGVKVPAKFAEKRPQVQIHHHTEISTNSTFPTH